MHSATIWFRNLRCHWKDVILSHLETIEKLDVMIVAHINVEAGLRFETSVYTLTHS
jgi:hypothetical protein